MLDGERDRIYGGWMAGRRPAREWLYPQIAQLKEVDRSVPAASRRLQLQGNRRHVGITESNVGVKISRIKPVLAGKRAEESTPFSG